MEPKLPSPNRGPEQVPTSFGPSLEYPFSPQGLERSNDGKHERKEAEAESSAAAASQQALPTPIQLPQPIVNDDNSSITSDDGVPLVAGDEDLIEKEWVDKAKAIVTKTRDDPYQREQQVGKLQAEYLKKRYGKELGAS